MRLSTHLRFRAAVIGLALAAVVTSPKSASGQVAVPTALQAMREVSVSREFALIEEYNRLMRQATSARAEQSERTRKGLWKGTLGFALMLGGAIGIAEGSATENDVLQYGGAAAIGVGAPVFSDQFGQYRRARQAREDELRALQRAAALGLRFNERQGSTPP